jgi:hypothetical protein
MIYGKSEKTKRVILWAFLAAFGTLFIIGGFWYIAVLYWLIIILLFVLDYRKKKKNRV